MHKGAANQIHPLHHGNHHDDEIVFPKSNIHRTAGNNQDDIGNKSLGMTTISVNRTPSDPPASIVVQPYGTNVFEAPGSLFRDHKRRIDFILAYEQEHETNEHEKMSEQRRNFYLQNLRKKGVDLETETFKDHDKTIIFIKVHIPFDLLCTFAERLHIEMPTKLQDHPVKSMRYKVMEMLNRMLDCYYCNKQSEDTSNPKRHAIHNQFDMDEFDSFDVSSYAEFFPTVRRNEIAFEILQKTRNHPSDEKLRGIEGLIEHGIFESAYPVHDPPTEDFTDRTQPKLDLYDKWASWKKIFSLQPLHAIRNYFGEKIGFYFLFMDFYTKFLIIPSAAGLIIFIIGMCLSWKDEEINAICDEDEAPGKYWMCPICEPPHCEPWEMFKEGCHKYKWAFALDNEGTLALSCFVMLWAILFFKFWKRRQAVYAFEWNTYNVKVHDAAVRPEYEEKAPMTRLNPITLREEPYVPTHLRILWISVSILATFIVLCIAGLCLTGLVLSRIALYRVFKQAGGTLGKYNVEFSRWFVHFLIFVMIVIFEKIYSKLVIKLTNIECPRTHHDFMSSMLWKFFVFELLNDFVPICYAAWLKGKTVDTPLHLNATTELCDGGCMAEVVELVFVLLFLRLLIGNLLELTVPFVKACIKRKKAHPQSKKFPLWLQDFFLNEVEFDGVFEDYMEMMIQFAFVVLFIAAFPLAPILCLINNIIEIRVDAIKMLCTSRRPVPIRVPGIQIWNHFLDIIVKLGVLFNAGLIAFTSDIIPKLYYEYSKASAEHQQHSTMRTHRGFTEYALSYVNVSDWHDHEKTEEMDHLHIDKCYYVGFRDPHEPWSHKPDFWRITSVRLLSFAIYSCVFFIIIWFVNLIIDDAPSRIEISYARQKHIVREHYIKERKAFAKSGSTRRRSVRIPPDQAPPHEAPIPFDMRMDTNTKLRIDDDNRLNEYRL